MRRLRSWFLSIPSVAILSRAGFRHWVQALGALVLLNLVVGVLWTYPRWQATEPGRQEAQQIADAGALVRPALSRARESYGSILAAEKDLRALQEFVATRSGSTAEAVEAIRRIVDEAGLSVTRITRRPESIDELGLLELQTKLPVAGSYASVRALISKLRSEGPFVAIDRIALSAPEASTARGSLAVEFGLSTFVLESRMPPPTGAAGHASAGNGTRMGTNGEPVDDYAADPGLGDPWAVVEEVRERLSSLPPLPVSPDSYRVRLSRLRDAPARHPRVSRNPFAFHSVAAKPPPTPQAPSADEPPPEPKPEPQPPPRIAHELIGVLEMADGRRATLKDSNGLYVVEVGDRLPGDIEVVSVGVDHAELEVRGVRIRLELKGVGR